MLGSTIITNCFLAYNALKCELDQAKQELARSNEDKFQVVQLLEKKNNELASLTKVVQEIQSQEKTNNFSLINEAKLKEIKLTFEEARLRDERILYNKEIETLRQELCTKTNDIFDLRNEFSLAKLKFKKDAEAKSDEIKTLVSELNRVNSLIKKKDETIEELSNKMCEWQTDHVQLEQTINAETEHSNEVVTILQKKLEDCQKELNGKNNEIADLRQALSLGYSAHNELEVQFIAMKSEYAQNIKEYEKERERLAEELEKCNYIISNSNKMSLELELEKYFPLAHNQQTEVVKLSDLYTNFIEAKNQLAESHESIAQMQETIAKLNDRINQDQPISCKKAQDYELVLEKNAELERDIYKLLEEKECFLDEKDDFVRTINTLKREIERYSRDNDVLSDQIKHLLVSIQEMKGFPVNPESTETRFTFKDIQGLQEKNRELFSLLNKMENRLDSQAVEEDKIEEYKVQIKQYEIELDNLRSDLAQKDALIESSTLSPKKTTRNSYVSDSELTLMNKDLMAKNEKLTDELHYVQDSHLKEKSKYQNQINDLMMENVSTKENHFKLVADLDRKHQELENALSSLEKYRLENVDLRERNIKLNVNLENLEKNVVVLKGEISSLKETLNQKDSRVQMALSERDIYKNNEINLLKDNVRLREDLEKQNGMIDTLRKSLQEVNQIESESIQSLRFQIEKLQQENNLLKEKVDKQKEKIKEYSAREHNLQIMLEKEKNKLLELEKQCLEMKMLSQSQKTVVQQEIIPADPCSTGLSTLTDYKKKLQLAQEDIKLLTGKLANSESAHEELEKRSLTLEENLNKVIAENTAIESELTSKLEGKSEEIENLSQQLVQLRSEHEQIVQIKNNEISQCKNELTECFNRIEQLQASLDQANDATARAILNESQVLDDLKIQQIIAAKAREDCEAQEALRSSDAKKISDQQAEIDELKQSLHQAQSNLAQLVKSKEVLESELDIYRKNCEDLKSRMSTLEQANDSLIIQIDLLNNQVISLENNSNLFMTMDEDKKQENAKHLLSVIKYLREDKTKLSSFLAKANDEKLSLQVEVANLNKQIETLKESLQLEKQYINTMGSNNEFNDLVAKAELVPVLNENLSKLRLEVSSLKKRCSELTDCLKRSVMDEKTVNELINKSEDVEAEKEALRNLAEEWKTKANDLAQQLRNCDNESIRKIMNEKNLLQRQVQMHLMEIQRLKQELEGKVKQVTNLEADNQSMKQNNLSLIAQRNDLSEKFNTDKVHRASLENRNSQLKALARKYKAEIEELKAKPPTTLASDPPQPVVGDKDASTSSQGQSLSSDLSKITELETELQEKNKQIELLLKKIQQLTEENDELKKQNKDKDEKYKKIAQQAKQKISEYVQEKNSLIKEKGDLVIQIDELRTKLLATQTEVETKVQAMASMRSEYDSKLFRQNQQLGELHLPSTSSGLVQSPSPSTAGPSIPVTKSTPTVSIKPTPVQTPSRLATSGHRPVTMVHPTATIEDSGLPIFQSAPSTSALPQALVQPTQQSTTAVPSVQDNGDPGPSASQGVQQGNSEVRKRVFDGETQSEAPKKIRTEVEVQPSMEQDIEQSQPVDPPISDPVEPENSENELGVSENFSDDGGSSQEVSDEEEAEYDNGDDAYPNQAELAQEGSNSGVVEDDEDNSEMEQSDFDEEDDDRSSDESDQSFDEEEKEEIEVIALSSDEDQPQQQEPVEQSHQQVQPDPSCKYFKL